MLSYKFVQIYIIIMNYVLSFMNYFVTLQKICPMRAHFVFCYIFVILFSFGSLCSEINNKNKSAKIFETAYMEFKANRLNEAMSLIDKALMGDKSCYNCYVLKGDIQLRMGRIDEAINSYVEAANIDTSQAYKIHLEIGNLLYNEGRYEEAKKYYGKHQMADKCDYAISLIHNPVPFNPISLGENVNSEFDEYFPTFTADDSLMIFTRRITSKGMSENEDFFISQKINNDAWGVATNMGYIINSPCNEGTPTISIDGNILLFTVCENNIMVDSCHSTLGRCDIFFSLKQSGEWCSPINLGKPVNSRFYESQPSLASDSRTLYFVRAEEDDYGKINQDIFYSTIDESGIWSPPIRLNSNINTSGREAAPFIHPDGRTFYFASDGHLGMGGMDIFVSRKDENGEWGKAENLGYPINTWNDETALVVSASGKWGYFSSDRAGGFGGIDIYRFEMPYKVKPHKTLLFKDETIVLNNIFFDTDDFTLKSESKPALDSIVRMMTNNSSLTIEISGHTDSLGSTIHNIQLSDKRAASVYCYLLDNNISPSRITYKGYGATKPITTNETERGRAKNRRIEMKLNGIISVDYDD